MATDYRTALVDQLDPEQKKNQDLQTSLAAGPVADVSGPVATAPKIGGLENTGISGGTAVTGQPDQAPAAASGPTIPDSWKVGANTLNPRGMILGFDTDKLNDPNVSSGKYDQAAKVFSQGLSADVGISRGGLQNMALWAQANGFPNAKVAGDDKIDFGDGNGPIDVIGSDGSIRFQNTTDNPQWEAKYGKGGGGGASAPASGASGVPLNGMLGGDPLSNINSALSQLQQPTMLQALLAQLQGQS